MSLSTPSLILSFSLPPSLVIRAKRPSLTGRDTMTHRITFVSLMVIKSTLVIKLFCLSPVHKTLTSIGMSAAPVSDAACCSVQLLSPCPHPEPSVRAPRLTASPLRTCGHFLSEEASGGDTGARGQDRVSPDLTQPKNCPFHGAQGCEHTTAGPREPSSSRR